MPSLNQYASHIATITGRVADHALKERVKQSIKSVFATRIRQSVDKIGIDDIFNLICEVPLVISDEFKLEKFSFPLN